MKKRQFTPEYKAKIVIEVLREEKTLSEIAAREQLAPTMVSAWKREFLENCGKIFSSNRDEKAEKEKLLEAQSKENDLMAKVGQLTIEVDWLKKKSAQVLGPDWETKSGYKKR